jgi:hypothetical protein
MIFGEGFPALRATIALKAVPMFTKAIANGLARMARHCGIPLVSHSRLPDNEFAGSSRPTAVMDSVPGQR